MRLILRLLGDLKIALHVGLLLLSAAVIFAPQSRSDAVRWLFYAGFAVETAWLMFRSWRAGMMTATPQESVDHVLKHGPITNGWIERGSLVAGTLAFVVLTISPH